jgi:hypothetical protein
MRVSTSKDLIRVRDYRGQIWNFPISKSMRQAARRLIRRSYRRRKAA